MDFGLAPEITSCLVEKIFKLQQPASQATPYFKVSLEFSTFTRFRSKQHYLDCFYCELHSCTPLDAPRTMHILFVSTYTTYDSITSLA